jgi:mono/diheme cytochrome c family protein
VKRSTAAIFILLVAAGGAAFYLMFFNLPRMYDQAHIRTGRSAMPPTPEGSVPMTNPVTTMPTTAEAGAMMKGLASSQENVSRGKVYYGYYCVACHGDAGDGRGPVGGSYIPTPADLRSPRVQAKTNGELYRAMLTGEGHAPVLERVVPPEHRGYLVLYVRSLGAASAMATSPSR